MTDSNYQRGAETEPNDDEELDKNHVLNKSQGILVANQDLDEQIDKRDVNVEARYNVGYMAWYVSITTIGGFFYGYDSSMIGVSQLYFSQDWPEITVGQISFIVSVAMIGGAIGALVSGTISDRYGRKPIILNAAFTYSIGTLIIAVSPSIALMMLGRFIVGLSIGAMH